ncbi:MAG: hypothetical protein ABF272_08775, partial [Flavobacteriales bacterium]
MSQERKKEKEVEEEIVNPEENPELFEHYKFTVDPGQEVTRVDKFLMNRLPNISRTKLKEAALNGYVKSNGTEIKP